MFEPTSATPRTIASGGPVSLCICVPARNEADRLPILLAAIAAQDWPGVLPLSIAINNTTDNSLVRIEEAKGHYAGRLDIHVVVAHFSEEVAHAGSARRLAMTEGLRFLSQLKNGVLISTDADARPPTEWLRNTMIAFSRGADLVGGKIMIDEEREPLPAAVSRLRHIWDRYWERVREIEDRLDPVDWDPAPRHGDHTGASLAIRAELYLRCGGVPLLPIGEDVALVHAAISEGGRLAHPANVMTRVSPRTEGRAAGGMAAAMKALFIRAEDSTAPMVPAFEHWAERAAWRKQMRHSPEGYSSIARREPLLPEMPNDMVLGTGE